MGPEDVLNRRGARDFVEVDDLLGKVEFVARNQRNKIHQLSQLECREDKDRMQQLEDG
jgi:hypothetical protein